jgi:hypothetical protein
MVFPCQAIDHIKYLLSGVFTPVIPLMHPTIGWSRLTPPVRPAGPTLRFTPLRAKPPRRCIIGCAGPSFTVRAGKTCILARPRLTKWVSKGKTWNPTGGREHLVSLPHPFPGEFLSAFLGDLLAALYSDKPEDRNPNQSKSHLG